MDSRTEGGLPGPSNPTDMPTQSQYFDINNAGIQEDIVKMIVQYLENSKYSISAVTLEEESRVRIRKKRAFMQEMEKLSRSIEVGSWTNVFEILTGMESFPFMEPMKYLMYKQQYLETLERKERYIALDLLTRKLKPLEFYESRAGEFKDLSYALTCNQPQDVQSFKDWDGSRGNSRKQLVDMIHHLLSLDTELQDGAKSDFTLPPNRLVNMLQRAVNYNIERNVRNTDIEPAIDSLLIDYIPTVMPSKLRHSFNGHTQNVKCVDFLGEKGDYLLSGSSDNTIGLWDTSSGKSLAYLKGHTSRIWEITSNSLGDLFATASGDNTVKLWNMKSFSETGSPEELVTFADHTGDVYGVHFHPNHNWIGTCSFDKKIRIFDVETEKLIKSFSGHNASVSKVKFSGFGSLLVSGGKDNCIKFWDILSGVCVHSISSRVGSVSSLSINSNSTLLLISALNNANSLWDLRMSKRTMKFKGNRNTSKNFIGSNFGPSEKFIIGGSEDALVYIWDINSGDIVKRLDGHKGIVYSAIWNDSKRILASCSDDSTLNTYE